MRVEFRRSFIRDLRRIRDEDLKQRVKATIERVERAQTLQEVENLRKLRGGEHYYRLRIGDYRVGLRLEEDVIIFIRFLHRRDIYRYFP